MADDTTSTASTTDTSTAPATDTSNKKSGFSLDWKSAGIAVLATVGVALLILLIVMLIRQVTKSKDTEKEKAEKEKLEKEQEDGKDKKKTEDKAKDQKSDNKSVAQSQPSQTSEVSTTVSSTDQRPATKKCSLIVNGEKQEYMAQLNEKTGKYEVRLNASKRGLMNNLVKARNHNNKIIAAARQAKEDQDEDIALMKEKTKTMENKANETDKFIKDRQNDDKNITEVAKMIGGLGQNALDTIFGKNVVAFDELVPGNIVNSAAKFTKDCVDHVAQQEEAAADAPKATEVINQPEVMKEVKKGNAQINTETINKAKTEQLSK